jgi:hypothetical protein
VQLGPIFQFNNPKKMALCPCLWVQQPLKNDT